MQEAPAAASNGDWMEPANPGQLWRIVPTQITASPVDLLLDQQALLAGVNWTSFVDQLQAAIDAAAAGQTGPACEDIDAYAHHVRAQSGKSVSRSLAERLLASAEEVRGLLGC